MVWTHQNVCPGRQNPLVSAGSGASAAAGTAAPAWFCDPAVPKVGGRLQPEEHSL